MDSSSMTTPMLDRKASREPGAAPSLASEWRVHRLHCRPHIRSTVAVDKPVTRRSKRSGDDRGDSDTAQHQQSDRYEQRPSAPQVIGRAGS